MGYYTCYTLEVFDKNKNNILTQELDNVLASEMAKITLCDYFHEPEEERYEGLSAQIAAEPLKWYDYGTDMLELSKCFPDYLFLIHGEGEESDDLWDHWFLDGKEQFCHAVVYYPPCTLV